MLNTSEGAEIVNVLNDLDHKATMAKNVPPHHLETFDFVPCSIIFRSSVLNVSWAS